MTYELSIWLGGDPPQLIKVALQQGKGPLLERPLEEEDTCRRLPTHVRSLIWFLLKFVETGGSDDFTLFTTEDLHPVRSLVHALNTLHNPSNQIAGIMPGATAATWNSFLKGSFKKRKGSGDRPFSVALRSASLPMSRLAIYHGDQKVSRVQAERLARILKAIHDDDENAKSRSERKPQETSGPGSVEIFVPVERNRSEKHTPDYIREAKPPLSKDAPFQQITNRPPWFGDGQRLIYAPSLAAFEAGIVPSSYGLTEVRNCLKEEGLCFLAGARGSGKTVLCLQAALSAPFVAAPSYFINMADWLLFSGAESTIATFLSLAGPDVLFVLDNCHASPDGTRAIIKAWKAQRRGSKLLLTGRIYPKTFQGVFPEFAVRSVEIIPHLSFFSDVAAFWHHKHTEVLSQSEVDEAFATYSSNLFEYVFRTALKRPVEQETKPSRTVRGSPDWEQTQLLAFFSWGARSVPEYLLSTDHIDCRLDQGVIHTSLVKGDRSYYSFVHSSLVRYFVNRGLSFQELYDEYVKGTYGTDKEWNKIIEAGRVVIENKVAPLTQVIAEYFDETDYDFNPQALRDVCLISDMFPWKKVARSR